MKCFFSTGSRVGIDIPAVTLSLMIYEKAACFVGHPVAKSNHVLIVFKYISSSWVLVSASHQFHFTAEDFLQIVTKEETVFVAEWGENEKKFLTFGYFCFNIHFVLFSKLGGYDCICNGTTSYCDEVNGPEVFYAERTPHSIQFIIRNFALDQFERFKLICCRLICKNQF